MSKAGGSDSKNTLYCSFCGKSQHEVCNLAIELEHKTQHTVRRRVLRSEIDGEVARRNLAHGGPPFGAPARQ